MDSKSQDPRLTTRSSANQHSRLVGTDAHTPVSENTWSTEQINFANFLLSPCFPLTYMRNAKLVELTDKDSANKNLIVLVDRINGVLGQVWHETTCNARFAGRKFQNPMPGSPPDVARLVPLRLCPCRAAVQRPASGLPRPGRSCPHIAKHCIT